MRMSRVGSTIERFYSRFKRNDETECWDWQGPLSSHGYGLISGEIAGKRYGPKGTRFLAHRVSWIIHFGDIPEGAGKHGTVVMHTCDNRACVNPRHLRLGSQGDNVQDMLEKGRKVSGTPSGVKHWNAAIKSQEDIDSIRSTVGGTKALAEKYGVHIATIKRIRKGQNYKT